MFSDDSCDRDCDRPGVDVTSTKGILIEAEGVVKCFRHCQECRLVMLSSGSCENLDSSLSKGSTGAANRLI